MSTAIPPERLPPSLVRREPPERDAAVASREIKIYGHSNLMYWWPVWAVGYLMALLTWISDHRVVIGGVEERIHADKNLGVIYSIVLFLVIVITNVTMRGLISAIVILTILFFTVLFAYLRWWEDILNFFFRLSVHMNLGFYVFFSTLVFIVWLFAVFGYDRFEFWRIRPGQVTHEYLFGGGERSYDTTGMTFEKLRDDLFRHWILGLGSGDLQLTLTGPKGQEAVVRNVLFVDAKIRRIQELIAIKPDESTPSA